MNHPHANRPSRSMKNAPKMMGPKAKDSKKAFKMLFEYIKPYRFPLIISIIFAIIGTVLFVLAPSYIGDITNLIEEGVLKGKLDYPMIWKVGLITAIAVLIGALFQLIHSFIMTKVSHHLTKKLRLDISHKFHQLPLKYYDSRQYGDILSIMTNDVDTIAVSIVQSLPGIIFSLTTIVGAIIMMLLENVTLFFVALISVPLSAFAVGFIVKFSQKFFVSQQRDLGQLNGHIEEVYSGKAIIKSFNANQTTAKEFNKVNEQLYRSAWKSQFYSDMMRPFMSFIGNLSYIAIIVVGGILLLKGQIGIGVIQVFIIYIRRLNQPMMQLAQTASTLQMTAASSERVFEFLKEPEMEDESNKLATIEHVCGHIEFKNVRFGYDENKIIIKNFSAEAKPGQKIAIVGPTGAGKTTMVNLLMRFYDITSGDILIDGISIYDMKREEVRKLFGMVLQETWVFDGTIQENVAYGNQDKSLTEIQEMCSHAHVDHFIQSLPGGYQMVLNENSGISGGQKQLLTIARAMVNHAPMLILDEATSNVDTRTEILIQKAMDQLTKGRTSFVIAHRLSTIKNADVILVMKEGDIIESGNHQTLLEQNGFYASLYNSQFESIES